MITRGVLTPEHELWPNQLLEMELPPSHLYYWGELDALKLDRVAIIGTRKPTEAAKKLTIEISQSFLDKAVVSGFAYGIDILAHLNAKTTIVVLSTRLEREEIYPPEHRRHIDTILSKGGLFISEYNDRLVGRQYLQEQQRRLIRRDSIVANIVDVIVPIQFRKTSGTIHAVNAGIATNKIFYVPLPSTKSKDYEGNSELVAQLRLEPFKVVKEK
jgi:DNA processing protein